MEQQVTYQERPRASVGGKVFLVLEMIALIFEEICLFIAKLFPTDAQSSIPFLMVFFWIVFFFYLAAYILLLIGTSSRNNFGVLVAGFTVFLLLEWATMFSGISSFSSFTVRLSGLSILNSIVLFTFTFVWISLIVLSCIKKAPKALCLIPGLFGVFASILLFYIKLRDITLWETMSGMSDGREIAYTIFVRIAAIIHLFVALFRPFWIFMVAHWLTHPTVKVAVRQGFRPITPQPVQIYGVQPQVPAYQQMPQMQNQPMYQNVPQQGYPTYQPPQQQLPPTQR